MHRASSSVGLLLLPLVMQALACDDEEKSSGSGSTSSVSASSGSASSTSSGTGGSGGAPDPHWSCLGEVEWPTVPTMPLTIQMDLVDSFDGNKFLQGASVRLCKRDDLPCASPQAVGVTDNQGHFSLTVDLPAGTQGWDGYVEVDPGPGSGYPVNLIVFARPASNDTNFKNGVISQDVVVGGVQLLTGSDPDPSKGELAMTVFDCAHEPAAHATIDVSPLDQATIGYAKGKIPTKDAVETDAGALAVVANVTPGFVTVTSKRVATGEKIASVTVPIRAGAITTFGLDPTPLP